MAEMTVADRRPAAGALEVLRDKGVYVALALLVLFNVVFGDNFATVGNLRLQLVQVAPVVIVALGMALVIGTEGIDLSVGAVMAIAAAVLPLAVALGPWVAVALAVAAGAAAGLVNGSLVAYLGVQPIVATLGLFVAGRGIALVLAGGRLTELFDPTLLAIGQGSVFGVPNTVLVAGGLTALVAVLVRRTMFGRRLVAIGGNRRAAELAGLPVRRTLVVVYVLAAMLAAAAGVMETTRIAASNPSFIGLLIELSAITAVVVGGTPLSGGRVRVMGTVAGAILIQLIIATLIRNDVPDSGTRMIQAVIIVAAVYFQRQEQDA